jgi:hypothetical protein
VNASNGTATLTSSVNPANSITVSLAPEYHSWCSTGSYRVTGGTGSFAGATGSGTVTFACSMFPSTYTDQWKGTLQWKP